MIQKRDPAMPHLQEFAHRNRTARVIVQHHLRVCPRRRKRAETDAGKP